MTEPEERKETPFDAEWEIRKLSARIMDVMDIVDDLKAKDKSLSARISRLRLASIEEQEEDELVEPSPEGPRFEDMTLEERALLYSELLDKVQTQPS